ncbi:MAG: ParA family protein [Nitrososphaeraceae archaeon]
MTKCIAFHSYKGGTGKSTISFNLSAQMVKRGLKVLLLDLDVYAPSLQTYLDVRPDHWINDFLFEDVKLNHVVTDLTHVVNKYDQVKAKDSEKGKLLVGFSNGSKDEIYRLEGSVRQDTSMVHLLRKFILIREEISSIYDLDYIVMDTSPGIRYWSINTLAIVDIILLSLKMDGIDIAGTRVMANEIYKNFSKLGTRSYLLLNRVAGYCHPPIVTQDSESESIEKRYTSVIDEQSEDISKLKRDLDMDVISTIPCYCDIQFDSKEYLTALQYPDHPFSLRINDLIDKLEELKLSSV